MMKVIAQDFVLTLNRKRRLLMYYAQYTLYKFWSAAGLILSMCVLQAVLWMCLGKDSALPANEERQTMLEHVYKIWTHFDTL